MKATAIGIASGPLCAAAGLSAQQKKPKGKRPNILIIHVDQLRIDCIGASGNKDVKTPHIDALAADGVRFANSFCPYPVCTPSRYSLLSGMYVHDHGGWSNRSSLSSEIATFPKILRSAGYKTKAVGKMHFTPTYLDVGFDELALAEQDGPGRWDDDYHRYLMEHNLVDRNDIEDQRSEYRKNAPKEYWETFGAITSNLPEEHHKTTWIADRAIETLDTWNADKSHLLMAGFINPHHPFDPPAPWDKMYDPSKLEILPGWTTECFDHDVKLNRGYFDNQTLTLPALRRVMAYYYATISQIDFHVGKIVNLLKKKGLYDNTLIVFTADHGEYMGHHHMLLKGNYLYDPLAKVPLIIKWPHSRKAGSVNTQLVNNIDLAPTICKFAQCKPAATMQGNDLASNSAGHDIIFSESGGGSQVMARTDKYKLILASPRNENLFFDLTKDPLETNNLYYDPKYAAVVGELEKALTEWRNKGPKPENLTEGPTIKGDNVPGDLSHRPAIIEYYNTRMLELQRPEG